MGERFNGIEEVVGSIPSGSTNFLLNIRQLRKRCLSSSFPEMQSVTLASQPMDRRWPLSDDVEKNGRCKFACEA